ncbi:hypothetical protein [Gymnodinialimonas ceratoperidinii]|uniref:Uncharacterized protein n=1 Tax=Gymnodinialimonas ceratoperidinii TaxID=2856823 RepID=A0A8F6TSQ1_9RHOB|nr:hypothetical protein [Gymnodinialimonas ceratoperidinii]QXT38277.1 hypothetical protein KYE46_09960 [Gymnodinialimonas ceratoperidinii]
MKPLILSAAALLLPAPATAAGLACTFTTICSPLTDCQTHDGVPFRFDVTEDSLRFTTPEQEVIGTPLPHIDAPAFAGLFETGPGGTILLSVSGTGEAVMTQQDIDSAGRVQSVSYFGICEPAA